MPYMEISMLGLSVTGARYSPRGSDRNASEVYSYEGPALRMNISSFDY